MQEQEKQAHINAEAKKIIDLMIRGEMLTHKLVLDSEADGELYEIFPLIAEALRNNGFHANFEERGTTKEWEILIG